MEDFTLHYQTTHVPFSLSSRRAEYRTRYLEEIPKLINHWDSPEVLHLYNPNPKYTFQHIRNQALITGPLLSVLFRNSRSDELRAPIEFMSMCSFDHPTFATLEMENSYFTDDELHGERLLDPFLDVDQFLLYGGQEV